MLRTLALTSAAALSLFCAACNGGDDTSPDDNKPGQTQDTRSNVTGTHPVLLSITIPGIFEAPEPIPTSLVLTEEADSRTALRIAFTDLDCDLTGTMTGASTFKVNPGSCDMAFPTEGQTDSCSVRLDLAQGSGGRDSAGAKIRATFAGTYTLQCAEVPAPITLPVTVEAVGT